ncbi:ankyrin repeat domain-containing protein 12-like [Cydia amplana]|uniref:ankyrin repeat domain-containing protein 12-like n=1 Tax=Cydia amplana TaxID=1869771 RepID=UPI002FE637FF
MYIHIRKTIEVRQKNLLPVKPKPPKDFNNYLMNRRTYTLQSTVNPENKIEIPTTLPPQMVEEFTSQEKERTRLVTQHLVEKEKLVLAVEQEILRVHGRAERAVSNQSMPYSVCTILRGKEIYTEVPPEQEENRTTRRGRCNGRQINAWLQEVDDKWEKIKEGMLRRQHIEAETLHAVQVMEWEWKLKEVGICDAKTKPTTDPDHVPQVHVSNFDLPA